VRNPDTRNWKHALGRPQFKPKPYPGPRYDPTPGLDALAAYLRKLRKALTG